MNSLAYTRGWGLLIVSIVFFLCACGPRTGGYPFRELDIPEQRIFNGYAFLKKERLADAQREFEQALRLQPKSSAAYRGMGLLHGMKKDFTLAFDAMSKAEAYAENGRDRALAEVGMMSLHRMETKEDWLERLEWHFDQASALSDELPEAYLELGLAYKQVHRFRDAEEAFTRIVKLNQSLLTEAREELEVLDKIKTADPRSALGKQVVLVKRINRAEIALLLAKEFPIDLIQARAGLDAGGKAPDMPPDVLNHPMKKEILLVLGLNIQGLRVFPDGSFGVDKYINRAGFATVMADLLVRGAGNPGLKQEYARARSPFQDVRSSNPHFTSIMICHDWAGIMRGSRGYFHPMETISGVDALLILREAENKLKGKQM
jgi:tetratricopeptide (TPR) repeat protein